VNGLANRLREHLRITQVFKSWVESHPDFEILAPVSFGAVCFRAHPRGVDDEQQLEALNANLLNAVNGKRDMFLSHTKLGTKYTLRMVIGHLRTEERHAKKAWDAILQELKHIRA
jgi:aromatic-L-amino-acid decarboxylase